MGKGALIERIKETWISRDILKEPLKSKENENKSNDGSEQVQAAAKQINTSDNEDGPIEDWTKQELLEECKKLEIHENGNKDVLIERIKETWISRGILKETHKSKSKENKQQVESELDKVENTQVSKSDDEDGPIEDWTKKELMEECTNLKIDETGNKNDLIERIKQIWISKGILKRTTKSEESIRTNNDEPVTTEISKSDDEDGPIEDWTKKELMEECEHLKIDETGNKNDLIERIKEIW